MTSTSRTVLLRSSWACVNIGDVAHSPGLVAALRTADPQAEVILWPMRVGERELAMLRRADPALQIVHGELDDDGRPSTPELAEAWDRADVLVHGSAAGAYLERELTAWRDRTGKPYGYAGITIDPLCPPGSGTLGDLHAMTRALPADYHLEPGRSLLAGAEFLFARDTITLEYVRSQGIAPATLEFGPDGTFAYSYADHAAGRALLGSLALGVRGFACFVPRLRYAPYPDIYGTPRDREHDRRYAINAGTRGRDLEALAGAITTWVRGTGHPALIVPEMSYAVELGHDVLPLIPVELRPRVHVLDRYWPLEEANAVYAQAGAVISMECHSPILASVHGTPTLYLRQPTETVKGAMYADLGAPEVVVEIDRAGVAGTSAAVTSLIDDLEGARERSSDLNRRAVDRLGEMARTILTGAPAAPYVVPSRGGDRVPAR